MQIRYHVFALLLCVSCNQPPKKEVPHTIQQFNGRDEIISYNQRVRRPVYQAKVPLGWQRVDPSEHESLMDTTKPIFSFLLEPKLRLSVHTFPTESLDDRIPPSAQVDRWRSQLKEGESQIEKVAHGGFVGLYFEGRRDDIAVCAWSLQLDMEHYQTLHFLSSTVEEEEHYKQMAADYTIKISGPQELIEKHRDELMLFANSFELIQEIPARM